VGERLVVTAISLGRRWTAERSRLADHLETMGVELLVSSPYTRAQQSVAPLAQRLRLPVEIDPRLAERVLSAEPLEHWREAIRQTFEELDLAWPGGESSRTAMARGRAAVDTLMARPAGVMVVVTHGNLMTLILRSFTTQLALRRGNAYRTRMSTALRWRHDVSK
jgi:2,3-bisphosphoglycerate-dependent phosphoglycerate mutase